MQPTIVALLLADFPMEHMQLQLQLPVEKEQELEQLIQELQDPNSPTSTNGLPLNNSDSSSVLAQEDIYVITGWLESHGFTVNVIYPRSIDFSGTARLW